jgi:hypothetical protein
MNNPASSADFDAVRAAFPRLGLAIYAYDPGGLVQMEVHTADGQVFPFEGPTLAALIGRAFPSLAPPPEPAPTTNVFD